MGASAGDLIRERVLLEAKRLLANSDLMISQIAETLNFEDNAYFTRFFKKYLGTTPEGFRAAYAQSAGLNL
jgi:AraC-like DNA-binding protein